MYADDWKKINNCLEALRSVTRICSQSELQNMIATLSELHQHWALGHQVKMVCLSCTNDSHFYQEDNHEGRLS